MPVVLIMDNRGFTEAIPSNLSLSVIYTENENSVIHNI